MAKTSPSKRGAPAIPKAAKAAPEAAALPRRAKDKAPALRRAEGRSPSQIQTAPASTEAKASAPAAAPKPATDARPLPASGPSVGGPQGSGAPVPTPDVEALAHNIAQAIEQGGRVLAAYMRPRESGEIKTTIADDIGEMVRSIGRVAEYYMADPQRALAAQAALATQFVDLWAATLQRLQGEKAAPIAPPDASDKRFADAAWRDNPYFDFIKQAYVLTTRWADDLVKHADELDAARSRQGAILSAPSHGGAVALELRRHQSGAHAHDARRKRREPRARPQNAGRRHPGRARNLTHTPGRRARVQTRRQPRRDPRQGDLPQ